jgi:hypothetical protein
MAYTAIDNPELYFQVKLYSGTGSSNAVTLDGDEDMQPDTVWIKCRSGSASGENHVLFDAVRGSTKRLSPDTDTDEYTHGTNITSFDSDGFTLSTNTQLNGSGEYVAWCWKETATAGFDIVAYTGNGTDDTDISHNLSAVPNLIIVKNRDQDGDGWQVYHGANTAAPETDYMVLNTNAVTADAADRWSDEAPTSSVFTLGDGAEVNTNTEDYIAYCFAEKQGFSKFGGYTGNGNADGPFIYTGFRPAFIMFKKTDTADAWAMFDNKRNEYNVINKTVEANVNSAEYTGDRFDIVSNGFKQRSNNGVNNASGGTYIYMAFAEAPFVNSNGVPCNAR